MAISVIRYTSAGIHNHAWAFFIAVGSLILALLGLISGISCALDLGLHAFNRTTLNPLIFEAMFVDETTVDYIFVGEILVRSLVLIVVSALLLYGNRTLTHKLYLPFIAYCFIFKIVLLIRMILLIGTYIFTTVRDYDKPHKIQHHLDYSMFSAPILIIFCLLSLQVFFDVFVKSGRKFLIDREVDEKLHNLNVE